MLPGYQVRDQVHNGNQPGEVDTLRFEIISQDPNLFIRYSDDGCGILPENFEPFLPWVESMKAVVWDCIWSII